MGVKLAHALLPTLDPLSGGGGAPSPDEPPIEPVFTRPRVEAGLLPGELHYLSISVPKMGTDRHAAIVADPAFGRELLFDGGEDSFCTVRLPRTPNP